MKIHGTDQPFTHFNAKLWEPPGDRLGDSEVYSVLREHGVKGTIHLHNPKDSLNKSNSFLDNVLIEYRIKHHSYPLFTVRDLFLANHSFSEEGRGNILGDIAERISRRITKFFLKHHSKEGNTGGIFDKRFNPQEKNGYIITNNDQYLLKIQNYPNLIILRKSSKNPWEYDCIKELDGFFDYRYHGKRHILVLESKVDRLNITPTRLIDNLFEPLQELFPKSQLHYVLFSNHHSLFQESNPYRILRGRPFEIYEKLKEHGVGTLFFSFNETQNQLNKAVSHLITQYKLISHQTVDMTGRIVLEHNKINLYDSGEHPFMALNRDRDTGLWRDSTL